MVKKLKPGLVASCNVGPGNGRGLLLEPVAWKGYISKPHRTKVEIAKKNKNKNMSEHLKPCLSSPDLLYAELLSMLIMLNMFITWVCIEVIDD